MVTLAPGVCPVCVAKDETIAILREQLAAAQAANKNIQDNLVNLADQHAIARLTAANRPTPARTEEPRRPTTVTALRRTADRPTEKELAEFKTDVAADYDAGAEIEGSFEIKTG